MILALLQPPVAEPDERCAISTVRSYCEESKAEELERAGNRSGAFGRYLAAYQNRIYPARVKDYWLENNWRSTEIEKEDARDFRLLEKIITIVRKLDRAPLISAKARAAFASGEKAVEGATSKNDYRTALHHCNQAVDAAPWWALQRRSDVAGACVRCRRRPLVSALRHRSPGR